MFDWRDKQIINSLQGLIVVQTNSSLTEVAVNAARNSASVS
jgi:hypothetical protein